MIKLTALALLLCSTAALAQSTSTTLKVPAPAASIPASAANTSAGDLSKSKLRRTLDEHLQVRYFSEFLGPSVTKWDDNQVDVSKNGNYVKNSEPIGIFHQFSLRWKVMDDTRVFVEPRFTTHFGSRSDIPSTDDQGNLRTEDFRAGLMSNYWTSDSKEWSTTVRVGNRFPMSRASMNADITAQPEALHITSWQINKDVNVSLWNQIRYYWYEPGVDKERWRLYTGPSVTYTFNDTYSLFVMYEHENQHNAAEGKRAYLHSTNILQDLYAGVNINLNPSLTVYPFIRAAQVSTFDDETLQVGAWIMGSIF